MSDSVSRKRNWRNIAVGDADTPNAVDARKENDTSDLRRLSFLFQKCAVEPPVQFYSRSAAGAMRGMGYDSIVTVVGRVHELESYRRTTSTPCTCAILLWHLSVGLGVVDLFSVLSRSSSFSGLPVRYETLPRKHRVRQLRNS